jgi:hypothetical protein
MNKAKKSQAFHMDFVLGSLILIVVVIIFFSFVSRIANPDKNVREDLIDTSKVIMDSMTSDGIPDHWNSVTVRRLGFVDEGNTINNTKYSKFNEIDYNTSKKLLGTRYDYFMFFLNDSNDVQNVEGFCATGSGFVNVSLDITAAYYYQGPGGEEFLKQFMIDEFQATVYYAKSNGAGLTEDQDAFFGDISTYDFVVVEHPAWSNSDFNDFVGAADPWLSAGGTLFVGGELGTSQNSDGFDVTFKKISGTSISDRMSTVVQEDPFIAFNLKENIVFRQAFYVVDDGIGASLKDIARFNESDIEFVDILDNKIALARWPWGEGKIFFFSDFDATYFSGDFQDIVKNSARKWINAICLPLNLSEIQRNSLVKTERFMVYKGDMIKMVLLVWD